MSRRHTFFAALAAALTLAVAPASAGARRPAAEPPAGCRPYSAAGDYACTGLELPFHTSGAGAATSDIWAGQWLFTDETGAHRIGSCVFNRGLHPRADDPARPVDVAFPNDPGRAKSTYLTWRYGATTDDLTAAALWAVFHFYAQDPAGSTRAADPEAPLVPSLDMVGFASGRADVQQRAIELDAEAARFAGPLELTAAVESSRVTVRVTAGGVGVPGVPVLVEGGSVGGVGVVLPGGGVLTGAAGTVVVEAQPGATVRAVATMPGDAAVYLGAPLRPHAYGGQSLITAGRPITREVSAIVPVPETTTTSTTTTTTTTTTTAPPTTTTTVAPTTSTTTSTTSTTSSSATSTTLAATEPTTVAPPPTTLPPPTPPTTPPVVEVILPAPSAPPPPATLPETGSTETVAAAAALVLGAGVGALVGLRRRLAAAPATVDEFWG